MTEKNKSEKMTNSSKPVPMKLFAAWEVDRTPSNCIPRLCTLRVTKLKVCGAINEAGGGAAGGAGAGAGAVILAARMHSSKRTLRSNDITVPPSDVELDLCFSLQYPHFVKRDGNRLQIMLQRRKKYKNRTILGYKTLAEGVIRMDQVLQRSMDMELELVGVGGKVGAAAGQPIAKLTITGLASTPVDHDTKNNNTLLITERGYSDEEEEGEFSSVEEADDMTYGAPARRRAHRQLAFNKADLSYTKVARAHDLHERYLNRARKRHSYLHSKHERDSDSELENASAKRKSSRGKLAQRNLKQKFAALLRRFRVPEELGERGAASDTHRAHTHIDQLFQELESLSCGEGEDSGPDQMDTISIGSTPKPSLRPFFSSSRSLANTEHRHVNVTRHSSVASATSDLLKKDAVIGTITESEILRAMGDERGSEGNSDGDAAEQPASGASVCSDPPNEQKEDKRSRLFRSATSGGNPPAGRHKKHSLVTSAERPLSAHDLPAQSPTTLEARRTISEQISRLFPASGAPAELVALCPAPAAPALLELGLPALVAAPPDTRLLLAEILGTSENHANHAVYTGGGRRACVGVVVVGGDAAGAAALRAYTELAARAPRHAPALRFYIVPYGGSNTIARYLCSVDAGYAALFADGGSEDPAVLTQTLSRYLNCPGPINHVPIGEAMIAYRDKLGEEDASQTFVPFIAEVRVGTCEGGWGGGGGGGGGAEGSEAGSPPARPSPPATPAPDVAPQPLDLQLDYWPVPGRQPEGADSKVTVKGSFRALHVTRHHQHLQVTYLTKEKKQKIMRLGKKKERPGEAEVGRAQLIDGVARLICSAKGSHSPLKVFIDGTEWNGVKFFQLSTQWQTHVKTFPVATCGAPLAPAET